MERKQIILIAVSVAVVLGLAVFVWVWQKGKLGRPAVEEPEGLGSELFKKTANPLGENELKAPSLPGANPLGEVETNPFKYVNPFE